MSHSFDGGIRQHMRIEIIPAEHVVGQVAAQLRFVDPGRLPVDRQSIPGIRPD